MRLKPIWLVLNRDLHRNRWWHTEIEMKEGGPGGRQSSSCKTTSEGLEEPIHLQQLPPTESEAHLCISYLLWPKDSEVSLHASKLQRPKFCRWWVQTSLPKHPTRWMIRVSPTTDKPGISNPLFKSQLERSLGTCKQARHSHSDSTPSARPTRTPFVPGLLPASSSMRPTDSPTQCKKGNWNDSTSYKWCGKAPPDRWRKSNTAFGRVMHEGLSSILSSLLPQESHCWG